VFADALPLDVSGRATVTLGEVLLGAPQLTRVDRKYLVGVRTAQDLLDGLPSEHRTLEVAGRVSTTYRSTYFDTTDLASCRAHVQQRRRRWKARSRLYVEDRLCRVEVKARDGRGMTAKAVAETHVDTYGRLDEDGAAFVRGALAAHAITADVRALGPTMEVSYRRTTLADTEHEHSRVTLDWHVQCLLDGERVWLDHDYVLVETKGGERPGAADRLLARLGARPRPFSKYVAAASLIRDDLHDNDVRRLRGRELHLERSAA
jgi:VTC domain